jgi:hypothetical protein
VSGGWQIVAYPVSRNLRPELGAVKPKLHGEPAAGTNANSLAGLFRRRRKTFARAAERTPTEQKRTFAERTP